MSSFRALLDGGKVNRVTLLLLKIQPQQQATANVGEGRSGNSRNGKKAPTREFPVSGVSPAPSAKLLLSFQAQGRKLVPKAGERLYRYSPNGGEYGCTPARLGVYPEVATPPATLEVERDDRR